MNNAQRSRGGNRGDILVTTAGASTDRTSGNTVLDNLGSQDQIVVPAFYVDHLTARQQNTIGPNLYWHNGSGPLLQIGPDVARSSADADRLTGRAGNLITQTVFVDWSKPLEHGLAPAAYPGPPGVATASGTRDLAARLPVTGASFFGAYYSPAR